jgi:hypothetical protein
MTMPMVTTLWRSSMRLRLRARVRPGTLLQCLGCRRNLSRACRDLFARLVGSLHEGSSRTVFGVFSFLTTLPDSPRNMPHVDPAKRREVICETQRCLIKQVDGVDVASAVVIGIWDRALKNSGPNIGFDYGGRLMAAWLDR